MPGIAGTVDIDEIGKRGYKILSSVDHSDPRVQQMLSAIQAQFRVSFYLSPHMRQGLWLISCGTMAMDLGMDRSVGS